jgi:hypothetical protein
MEQCAVDSDHMSGRFASLLRQLLLTPAPFDSVQEAESVPSWFSSGTNEFDFAQMADSSHTDALRLAETINQAAMEQDQILSSLWGGTGGGNESNLLSTLWSPEVLTEINAFLTA